MTWCQACKRELSATEPVYRCSLGYSSLIGGRAVVHVCGNCIKPDEWGHILDDTMHGPREWRPAKSCEHCHRPVIHDQYRPEPSYISCGPACRDAIYAANQREPGSMLCCICGASIHEKRSGAMYCSARCKQSAYRARQE